MALSTHSVLRKIAPSINRSYGSLSFIDVVHRPSLTPVIRVTYGLRFGARKT